MLLFLVCLFGYFNNVFFFFGLFVCFCLFIKDFCFLPYYSIEYYAFDSSLPRNRQ